MGDAFNVTGQLHGITEAIARLGTLKQGARNRILRPAMAKASQLIAKRVKLLAPVAAQVFSRRQDMKALGVSAAKVSRLLQKAVAAKVVTRAGLVVGMVGVRRGFKTQIGRVSRGPHRGQAIYQDPARIAHLVELGHAGPHPAPPHSFLQKGFDETQDAALDVLAGGIADNIAKVAAQR